MTLLFRPLFRYFRYLLVGLALSGLFAACSAPSPNSSTPSSGSTPPPAKLTLVSYAVTQGAYSQIIPEFVEQWKAKTGQEVTFDQSYGGSGSQTRAVIDGLEADVVALALALDTKKIEKAGLIQPGWEAEAPNEAIVTRSVAALVKRKDDTPVKGWSDLTNGVKVITANPKTSGGAIWNLLGLWGSVTQSGGTPEQAQTFLEKVFQNVPVLPKDAREASDVFFKQSQGDVLINYENEVLLAKQKGADYPFAIPTTYNISIDNPIAVVDANVDKHGTREIAEAFVQFVFTPEAQKKFASVGFRPVEESVAKEFADQYPKVENLFTVKDFGGWDAVQAQFLGSDGIFDKILNKIGEAS